MKEKLCIFISNQDWYFCSHWISRAKAIQDANFKVLVAVPIGDYTERIRKAGFEVMHYKLERRILNPFFEVKTFLQLYKIIRSSSPQLIISSTIKPNIYGSWIGRFLSIPTVSSINGLGFVFSDKSFKGQVLRNIAVKAFRIAGRGKKNFFVFQNENDQLTMLEKKIISKNKTRIIAGAGVNPDQFSYSMEPKSSEIKILFAARLLWNKGLKDLIYAVKILRRQNLQFRLIIAGILDKGSPNAVPEQFLLDWHQSGLITWIGESEKISDLISKTHIAVLPTFYGEGVPKFLIEAASCGRPLVTTNTPGCNHICRHEINGLLVPPKKPELLANALERLIKSPKLRSDMGAESRKIVLEEFSDDIVISKTLKIYLNLANG